MPLPAAKRRRRRRRQRERATALAPAGPSEEDRVGWRAAEVATDWDAALAWLRAGRWEVSTEGVHTVAAVVALLRPWLQVTTVNAATEAAGLVARVWPRWTQAPLCLLRAPAARCRPSPDDALANTTGAAKDVADAIRAGWAAACRTHLAGLLAERPADPHDAATLAARAQRHARAVWNDRPVLGLPTLGELLSAPV
jgi:hypothetical protein